MARCGASLLASGGETVAASAVTVPAAKQTNAAIGTFLARRIIGCAYAADRLDMVPAIQSWRNGRTGIAGKDAQPYMQSVAAWEGI